MKTLSKRIGDRSGYLFIAPAVIFMGIFIVYPMVSSVSLSMTNWYGLKERTFIGLENYGHLIRDPVFWQSLKLQFIWAVMSVVLLAIGGGSTRSAHCSERVIQTSNEFLTSLLGLVQTLRGFGVTLSNHTARMRGGRGQHAHHGRRSVAAGL